MNFSWMAEKSNKARLFWSLQFLFGFTHWFINIVIEQERVLKHFQMFLTITVNSFLLVLLTLILRYFYKKFRVHQLNLLKIILVAVLLSVLCGILYLLSMQVSVYFIYGNFYWEKVAPQALAQIWFSSYSFGIWSAIYIGFKIYDDYVDQKQNAERAISLAQNAQLEMLRYQLNPHFLFNTLSSLRALIRNKDNDIAEEMVTKISEFLKYSLLEGENNKVPLSQEIKIIKHYFDIEKVRFKEQLEIEYNIDPLTENVFIPVFLIHPLIENAVKHGMKTSPSPLRISIQTKMTGESLQIDLFNTGQWIERNNKDLPGTGLQNTRRRLELAYPGKHSFEIIKESGTVHIKLIIKKD